MFIVFVNSLSLNDFYSLWASFKFCKEFCILLRPIKHTSMKLLLLLFLVPFFCCSQEVWNSMARCQVERDGILQALVYFDDGEYSSAEEAGKAAIKKLRGQLKPNDKLTYEAVTSGTYVDREDEEYIYNGEATLTVNGGKRGRIMLKTTLDDCNFTKRREIAKALYNSIVSMVEQGEYFYDRIYIRISYCKTDK